LTCTGDQVMVSVPIPALERYNGPAYKSLRKHYDLHPEQRFEISTTIISAKYGLLYPHTLVPFYDAYITPERAQIHNRYVPDQLKEWMLGPHPETGLTEPPQLPTDYDLFDLQMYGGDPDAVRTAADADEEEIQNSMNIVEALIVDGEYQSPDLFVMVGRDWMPIIRPVEHWIPEGTRVHYAQGSLVWQRTQLLAWLNNKPIPIAPRPGRKPSGSPQQVGKSKVDSNQVPEINGITITASLDEILIMVDELLEDNIHQSVAAQSRRWVAVVGPYKVSPKWLVSIITGLSRSAFDASRARTLLQSLGIECVEDECVVTLTDDVLEVPEPEEES